MATNYNGPGMAVPAVAPSGGVVSGDLVKIGAALFGVALDTAAQTEAFTLGVVGDWTVAKDNNLVITAGDRLFYDATNGWLDKTTSSQTAVAVAIESAGQTDTTVRALFGYAVTQIAE